MPSNAPSERSDAVGGSASKASLLWAYQLRREHVHLVQRIDGMDVRLVSCSSKTDTYEQSLSNLDSLIRSLQAENHSLKNEVTLVRTKLASKIDDISERIAAIVSDDGAMKDATKKLEVEFRGMGLQVSGLSDRMDEFRADLDKVAADRQNETQETRELVESRQVNGEVEQKMEPKTPKPVQAEIRPRLVVKLKYKNACTRQSPEPSAKIIDDALEDTSMVDQADLSTLTDSYVSDSMPPPDPIQEIFREIRQNDRTLHDYFTYTSQLRRELPRRKQEGHIVEAFFDGIAKGDDAFKASLEEYLDGFGWIWANLEIFCKPRALRKKRKAV